MKISIWDNGDRLRWNIHGICWKFKSVIQRRWIWRAAKKIQAMSYTCFMTKKYLFTFFGTSTFAVKSALWYSCTSRKKPNYLLFNCIQAGKEDDRENKTNVRWWQKIMKDIILWDISIGNGYCRRRFSCTVTVAVAVTISLKSFFSSFFKFVSRLFMKHRMEYRVYISFGYTAKERERKEERKKEKSKEKERDNEWTFYLVEGDNNRWMNFFIFFYSFNVVLCVDA